MGVRDTDDTVFFSCVRVRLKGPNVTMQVEELTQDWHHQYFRHIE